MGKQNVFITDNEYLHVRTTNRERITIDTPLQTRHDIDLRYKIRFIERTYSTLLSDKPPSCLWDIRLFQNLRNMVIRSFNLLFAHDTYMRFTDYNKEYLIPRIQRLIQIVDSEPKAPRPVEYTIEHTQHVRMLNIVLYEVVHNLSYLAYHVEKLPVTFFIWVFNKAYYILSHTHEKYFMRPRQEMIKTLRGLEERLLPISVSP